MDGNKEWNGEWSINECESCSFLNYSEKDNVRSRVGAGVGAGVGRGLVGWGVGSFVAEQSNK